MSRNYSSFVLRVWRLGDDDCWVEVEHVQSGECVRLDSVGLAAAWVAEHSSGNHRGARLAARLAASDYPAGA